MRTPIAALIVALFLALPAFASAAYVDLPAGALLDGTLLQEINSKTAQDGQRFTMLTSSGSKIFGHLSEVRRASVGRKAHLKLNFDTIRFDDGTSTQINAALVSVSQRKKTNYGQAAGQVLGGLIAGNVLGKAIGTNVGGLFGVAGGALLAANTSYDIDIAAGSPMTIKLTAPLVSGRPQAR